MGVLVSVGSGLVQKLVSDGGCTSGSGSMVAVSTIPLPSGVHLSDESALLGCPALLKIHTYFYIYDSSIAILPHICTVTVSKTVVVCKAKCVCIIHSSSLIHIPSIHFHFDGHSEGESQNG